MVFQNKLGDRKDGKVYKVLNISKYTYSTIKQMYIEDQAEVFNVIKRLGFLEQLDNKHINRVQQIGMGSQYKTPILYLMFQFYDCNLKEIMMKENLRNLSIAMKIEIAQQIGLTLHSLHSHKHLLIHGNLRPENVLVQYQDQHQNIPLVILTDACLFLKSKDLVEHANKKDPYIPPEIRSDRQGNLTQQCDIWAYGILLFQLFSEESISKTKSEREIATMLENCNSINQPNLMASVRKCLSFKPSQRPRIMHIVRVLDTMKSKYQIKPHLGKLNIDHENGSWITYSKEKQDKYETSFSTENTNKLFDEQQHHLHGIGGVGGGITFSDSKINSSSSRRGLGEEFHTGGGSASSGSTSMVNPGPMITPRKKLEQILSLRSFDGSEHSGRSPQRVKDIKNLLFQANLCYVQGEIMEGLKLCEEALAKDSESNIEVLYMKAKGYRVMGENYRKNYVNLISYISNMDPLTYDNLCYLARVLVKETKNYKKAINAADQAIQIDPDKPTAYLWKGVAYFYEDFIEKSLKTLDQCLSRCNEQDCLALSLKAYGLVLIDQLEEAEVFFKKAESIAPTSFPLFYYKAKSAEEVKEFEKAKIMYLRCCEIDPLDQELLFQFVQFLKKIYNLDSALLYNEKLAKITSHPEKVAMQRGSIFIKKRQFQEALVSFRKAQSFLQISDPGTTKSSQVDVLQLAKNYEIKTLILVQQYQEAENEIKSILDTEPRHEDTLFNKAYLMEKNQQYDQVKLILVKLLTIDPQNIKCYLGLARIEKLLGNTTECINNYDKALKYDRKNATILYLKACALMKMDRPDESKETLDQMKQVQSSLFDIVTKHYELSPIQVNQKTESQLEQIQEIQANIMFNNFQFNY